MDCSNNVDDSMSFSLNNAAKQLAILLSPFSSLAATSICGIVVTWPTNLTSFGACVGNDKPCCRPIHKSKVGPETEANKIVDKEESGFNIGADARRFQSSIVAAAGTLVESSNKLSRAAEGF